MTSGKRLMQVFDDSRSSSWDVRRDAARALGRLLPATDALARLVELLDDEDVGVEQEAAESLVRFGGDAGLLAVLEALGRRVDDPDADYIAYRVRELQIFEQVPVLDRARDLGREHRAVSVSEGIRQLEALLAEWEKGRG